MPSSPRYAAPSTNSPGYFDAANPANSKIELKIKAASIDTRSPDRDAHLRSNDFFDMETCPEISFSSNKVARSGPTQCNVEGYLTRKGVSRPVSIDFEHTGSAVDPYGDFRIGLEGTTSVNRRGWGINWNAALEAGGVLVSENVTLEFEVSAIHTPRPA